MSDPLKKSKPLPKKFLPSKRSSEPPSAPAGGSIRPLPKLLPSSLGGGGSGKELAKPASERGDSTTAKRIRQEREAHERRKSQPRIQKARVLMKCQKTRELFYINFARQPGSNWIAMSAEKIVGGGSVSGDDSGGSDDPRDHVRVDNFEVSENYACPCCGGGGILYNPHVSRYCCNNGSQIVICPWTGEKYTVGGSFDSMNGSKAPSSAPKTFKPDARQMGKPLRKSFGSGGGGSKGRDALPSPPKRDELGWKK